MVDHLKDKLRHSLCTKMSGIWLGSAVALAALLFGPSFHLTRLLFKDSDVSGAQFVARVGPAVLLSQLLLGCFVLPALLVLSYALYTRYLERRAIKKVEASGAKLPPGDLGYPLAGNTIELVRQGHHYGVGDLFRQNLTKHGAVWLSHLFGTPAVFVSGAANLKRVLNAEFVSCNIAYPSSTRNVIGDHALLFLPKDKHKAARGILMRAFTPAAVETYLPTIERLARKSVESWLQCQNPSQDFSGAVSGTGHGTVKFADCAQAYTFEVAKEVILGLELDQETSDKARLAFKDFREGIASPFVLPFPGTNYTKGIKARNYLLDVLRKQLAKLPSPQSDTATAPPPATAPAEAGAGTASGGAGGPSGPREGSFGSRPNAMKLLLGMKDEDGNELSEEELLDQLLLMLFAGHDTSSSALSVALLCLGLHPEAYARMQAEQDRVVAAHGEALSAVALSDMAYTEAVIKETLRIRPVAGSLARRTTEDMEVGGWTVPKGWLMMASIRATHASDPVFGGLEGMAKSLDHMSLELGFKPERWLEDSTRPEAWFPFGGGPRLCLGMNLAIAEMKALLAIISRRCEIMLLDKDTEMAISAFPAPRSGVPLTLVARK